MPNIKSAIKRVKIAERNRIRNFAIKSSVRTAIKKLKDSLLKNNTENISELLSTCYSRIDKAVTKGVFHQNKASRQKSRLAAFTKKSLETLSK